MKKFLPLILASIFLTVVLFLNFKVTSTFAQADQCATTNDASVLADCIDSLTRAKSQSELATAGVQKQIDGIKARVASIEAEIPIKEKQITDGEKRLEKLLAGLNAAIRNLYINTLSSCPLCELIASPFYDFAASQAREESVINQNKIFITNAAILVKDLKKQKDALEKEKTDLAIVKSKLDKVVTEARVYQASLSSQIATLSQKQQQIIAAKQAALASVAGSSIDTQSSGGACAPQVLSNYPSTIRVKFPDGHIETMPFEDQYLKGLGEMPRSWKSENNYSQAFKAQVVAARSYALYKMVRSSCRDFDVYSTTADQVYTGNTSDGDWNSAVADTKGQFIQNGGSVIIAYYSANAGGYTLTPNEAWGAGGGFPSSVNDIGNDGKGNADLNARCLSDSHYRWEYHYNVGRDGKIQYNDTCPGGDINNNNSSMTNSEVEDIVDATTWALSHGNVPDNSVSHDQIKNDIGGNAIGTIQSISASIADNKYTNNIHVVGSNRTLDFSGSQAQTFRTVFNIRSPGQFLIPSTSYGAQFVKFDILNSSDAHGTQGSGWYFYTYGYGHRIGLDQNGALGLATQGMGYADIISHYYQGTSLTSQGYSGSVQ